MTATPHNTTLTDYGIARENSDIRAHVCVVARQVLVFPTRRMVEVAHEHTRTQAMTGRIVTSNGVLVPVTKIPGLQAVQLSKSIVDNAHFSESDTTSEKGRKAVLLVMSLLGAGRIPLPVQVEPVDESRVSEYGTDLVARAALRIQVKCDWRGGETARGGSGNVYIELAECNPYRAY